MDRIVNAALQQLDEVIRQFGMTLDQSPAADKSVKVTRMRAVVMRLTPSNSVYRIQTRTENQYELLGVVKALRDDYASGYMKSFRQLVNADLFSDFLSMAEYLIESDHLKQPAAVLAGGVLEEHIRKLCDDNSIPIEVTDGTKKRPKKVDTMNAELAKADVYGKNDQKQVTAWCGIRNSAAHAQFDEFDEVQVRLMITGIRDFISRFPA